MSVKFTPCFQFQSKNGSAVISTCSGPLTAHSPSTPITTSRATCRLPGIQSQSPACASPLICFHPLNTGASTSRPPTVRTPDSSQPETWEHTTLQSPQGLRSRLHSPPLFHTLPPSWLSPTDSSPVCSGLTIWLRRFLLALQNPGPVLTSHRKLHNGSTQPFPQSTRPWAPLYSLSWKWSPIPQRGSARAEAEMLPLRRKPPNSSSQLPHPAAAAGTGTHTSRDPREAPG